MDNLTWFLPAWPLAFGDLMLFGALLIAGLLGGELVNRITALPRITGYVLVGVAAGPHALGLASASLFAEARVFVDLALGLIVFELGHRFDLDWLGRNRWLALAALGESVGAFFAIYAALTYYEYPPLLAACAAAVGTATSPAVVMVVSHEMRASGQITERMLLFTAVNCVFAYVALMLFMPLIHLQHETSWRSAILHPMYLLAGAALLGFAGSQLLLWIAKWLGKREDRQFILLVALVVLVVGLVRALNLPVVVALLTLGILARNLDYDHALLAAYAQALAAWLLEERTRSPSPAVYHVNAFNHFEACRFGYLGQLVDPYARRKRTIVEDILETFGAARRDRIAA